jgi:phosphatidylethanolamine-binding protein (PEBP) family uncharacterized protein
LDNTPDVPASAAKYHLEKAMGGHILAFGELFGIYKRQ